MVIDVTSLQQELTALMAKHEDRNFDPAVEADNISTIVGEHLSDALAEYVDPHVIDYGGSGIVIKALSTKSNNTHAIKFPRHHLLHPAPGDPELPAVNRERELMELVSHKNIVRLFNTYPLPAIRQGVEVLAAQFVEEPKSLAQYAKALCCTAECARDRSLLAQALMRLAALLYDVVDAIAYLHDDVGLLHFDIKPDNILIAKDHHAYLTDFGLAQRLSQQVQGKVDVGFTWKYAHPFLKDTGLKLHLTDVRRVRNEISPDDFSVRFDLYALGRTIQEILWVIEREHGPRIYSQYSFNYLHMIAALCLDGHNATRQPSPDAGDGAFTGDLPMDMPPRVFQDHRFSSCVEVKAALERLIGLRRLEDELPEVNTSTSSTINVTEFGPTPITDRVLTVINHPTMRRLHSEQQLGMIETIYPTATHTRLEHSIGVYHNAREYLRSLYYDPENPTFRVLFSDEKGRLVLLASLVHDIGHTAFGHDMEEVEALITGQRGQTYNHLRLGLKLLESRAYLQNGQATLADIIARPVESGGWGINLGQLTAFLERQAAEPFDFVLKAIIDGPVDADKLDYLIRDSVNCRVTYGRGIDHQRFWASLTTTSLGNEPAVHLAIKRKGAASAEDILITRYQLHQSVYWHHTFRCVKSMFTQAASLAVQDLREGIHQLSLDEADAYYQFVLERRPLDKPKGKDRPSELRQRLIKSLDGDSVPPVRSKWAADRTFQYLWRISTESEENQTQYPWTEPEYGRVADTLRTWERGKAKQLLVDLLSRRFYKRVLEVPITEYDEGSLDRLKDVVSEQRPRLLWQVTRAILDEVNRALQEQSKNRESIVRDRLDAALAECTRLRVPVLIDVPPPENWIATSRKYDILFVDDYKRRYFRSHANAGVSNAHWTRIMPQMMRGIAHFRVFCEPDLHDIITRVVHAGDLGRAVESALGLTHERR